ESRVGTDLGGAGVPAPSSGPPAALASASAFPSAAREEAEGPGAAPKVTGWSSHWGGQLTSAYCGWFCWPLAAAVWPSGPVSSGLETALANGELSSRAAASG